MNAHYAEGFRDLQTYSAGDKDWRLIILDQSVWNRDGRKAYRNTISNVLCIATNKSALGTKIEVYKKSDPIKLSLSDRFYIIEN